MQDGNEALPVGEYVKIGEKGPKFNKKDRKKEKQEDKQEILDAAEKVGVIFIMISMNTLVMIMHYFFRSFLPFYSSFFWTSLCDLHYTFIHLYVGIK
jgi:hypothetical protein